MQSDYNIHVYTGRLSTLQYEFCKPYASSTLVLRFSDMYLGYARLEASKFTVYINGSIVARNINVHACTGGRLCRSFDLR